MAARNVIHIYTDGASRGNPGPGGFGVVLMYKDKYKELSEGYKNTTNNRMELMAVIRGLEAIKEEGWEVQVYSDSQYVVNAVKKGWLWGWQKKGFKDKKNPDLWKRFIELYNKHKVHLNWVRGHAGDTHNERCDTLAVQAAESRDLKEDTGYYT